MSQWTQADVDRIRRKVASTPPPYQTLPSTSKYRNVKVEVNGEKFDSKREAAYWIGLKAREAAGEITDLKRQVSFTLRCPTMMAEEEAVVAHYIADFTFCMEDGLHVLDAKGKRTAMYQLKKKWLELQDGIVIEEV
jgi:glyoxylate utilization-related uncharacterized protein